MDILGNELCPEENKVMDILGSKAFKINRIFLGASHRDNILEFTSHVDFCKNKQCLLKYSKMTEKREIVAAKWVVFNLKKKRKNKLAWNSWWFSCNYLIKGLQRRVLLQDLCQKELCKKLEFQSGMAQCDTIAAHLLWMAAAAQHWAGCIFSLFTDNCFECYLFCVDTSEMYCLSFSKRSHHVCSR